MKRAERFPPHQACRGEKLEAAKTWAAPGGNETADQRDDVDRCLNEGLLR